MIQINKKTYAKLLKAKNRICNYCETSETDNCEDCSVTKTINAAVDKYGSETVILNNSTCMQDEKPTTLYKVIITLKSNGCYESFLCIMQAENENTARENLNQWIYANHHIFDKLTNRPDDEPIRYACHGIKPLTENKYGIVYQKLFEEDNKICTEHDTTDKLYEIKFTTTTRGTECDYLCIMRAKNKKQAKAKLYEWLSNKLQKNYYIAYYRTKITRITEHEYGIIYHDYKQKE